MPARIHRILAGRGLTLFEIVRESRRRYPSAPAYWIPHHFYADLAADGFSPRVEQVSTFSAVSGYRFVDWLRVFGVRLDDGPPLATQLPTERTILLDAQIYDSDASIDWFRSKPLASPPPAIAPLGQLIESGNRRPLRSLVGTKPSPFLYAKIGQQDALAFPDLLPGSIVRVDTRLRWKRDAASFDPSNLFLVEQSQGLVCCRLHSSRKQRVTLRSMELPYAEIELQLDQEARVLGTLDWEFRFLEKTTVPRVARALAKFGPARPLPPNAENPSLHHFVKQARLRAGLSLRNAATRSGRVAKALGDNRYLCTRGTLAAYETSRTPPRHIHKLFALCILYSMGFWEVLAAAGLNMDGAGQERIPTNGFVELGRAAHRRRKDFERYSGFLSQLAENVEEIPFFLRSALGSLTGLPRISLRDVIWLGEERRSLHPYLRTTLLAAVRRQSKRPVSVSGGSLWEQPLYLLLLRNGSYLCAGCSREKDTLVVHPFANGFERPIHLRNREDAEVVGKLVALLRRL